jgi:hypothetical protein
MRRENPGLDAEWIMEAIVDDFAQSFDLPERMLFYARISELASERRNIETIPNPEPPRTCNDQQHLLQLR